MNNPTDAKANEELEEIVQEIYKILRELNKILRIIDLKLGS